MRIEYASESVWLRKRSGIPDIILDVLVKNESSTAISAIWCIVPQRLFEDNGELPETDNYADVTEELSDVTIRDTPDKIFAPYLENGKPMLDLKVVDPTNVLKDITYSGTHFGNNEVAPLQKNMSERMVTNGGPFGVLQIKMRKEIEHDESRWMRLRFAPLSGPRENRNGVSRLWDYITDRLQFHYNVAGPTKVRYEVEQHLAQMGRIVNTPSKRRSARASLSIHVASLLETLVENGIGHSATSVSINDWRTRFFLYPMESFASIETNGAVRAVGPHPWFPPESSRKRAYYEWATGDLQIKTLPPDTEQGYFNIRFVTKYSPRLFWLKSLMAVLGFILAVISIYLTIRAPS